MSAEKKTVGRKLLTSKQRTMLTQVALRGWKRLDGQGATSLGFNDWRHREAVWACGAKISEAPADAFDDLFIHFLMQAGDAGEAYERAVSGKTNAQRQLVHRIGEACAAGGVPSSYALAIAKDKWESKLGRPVNGFFELPVTALKTVLYDTKRAMRRRGARGV